jgi:Zn-dependent protease with chaperone function
MYMRSLKFSASKPTLLALLALLLAQPLTIMAQAQSSSPQLPDPGNASMSRQQQQQLGLQAAGEVYKQMPVLPDSSPETRYIQELGKKLEKVVPADKSWPYQFHVIPAADINAFALPGGPIFVNLGTIQAADNEAELAGVLAHEMSHVYMQHSAKQAPKATVAQIIAGLAGAVLPQSGVGNLARMGINIGAGGLLMKYSRKDEAQADSVGAVIMYRADYNPKSMGDFFQKLEQKYGAGGPQFLSDHPNPGNRQASIQKQIRSWPQKNYAGNSGNFARAKQDASRQKAYTAQELEAGAKSGVWAEQNRKNGVMPANIAAAQSTGEGESNAGSTTGTSAEDVAFKQVKPSGNFTQMNGSGFTIGYPDNWKVAGDANTTIIAPPSNDIQSGIAYGILIGSGAGSLGASFDDSVKKLADELVQQNPGMRISSEQKPLEHKGIEGRSLELSGDSPLQLNGKPLPERDWVVVLPRAHGDGLLYLVFVSPDRDFNQLHPTFQKVLESLELK